MLAKNTLLIVVRKGFDSTTSGKAVKRSIKNSKQQILLAVKMGVKRSKR